MACVPYCLVITSDQSWEVVEWIGMVCCNVSIGWLNLTALVIAAEVEWRLEIWLKVAKSTDLLLE